MLRKRYYVLFVARQEDGRVRRIPIPLHYVGGFVAAAVIGAFTIVGLAGSYTRMLLKTERFNQVRADRENLRRNYTKMAQIAHDRDVQVASLGALASEISSLYGLKQNKLTAPKASGEAAGANALTAASPLTPADGLSQQQLKLSVDQFYALRSHALSGRLTRALDSGLTSNFAGDWTELADAPSLWPVQGAISSSFGERQDPFNGEGAFHSGIDIRAPIGTPVRSSADGTVTGRNLGSGYGLGVEIDHRHGVDTVYAHLSSIAVFPGQHVSRGQVIGYVGSTGRSTGSHLHYEVRVRNVPVNPHKYLRATFDQMALNQPK